MTLSRDFLVAMAQTVAQHLMAEIDGARAVVVASADGFSLANAGHGTIEPARVAAMASSIAALGDAASRETQIGELRCLVVESTAGRLVVRCMQANGETLVVALLTDSKALLGMVWTRMADAERLMAS